MINGANTIAKPSPVEPPRTMGRKTVYLVHCFKQCDYVRTEIRQTREAADKRAAAVKKSRAYWGATVVEHSIEFLNPANEFQSYADIFLAELACQPLKIAIHQHGEWVQTMVVEDPRKRIIRTIRDTAGPIGVTAKAIN